MSPKKTPTKKRNPSSDDEDEYDVEEEGGHQVCNDIYIPPPPKSSDIQDGRRLVITQIEINNFKSYGQTQLLGPFHKCFTSIVGPNGSGKSNVIDAMLFVFGYRAQKLRLRKLSLLIHNSDTYPNCQSCSVKVYFASIYDKIDNEMDVIENTQFTISRTALKDNSSYYCIDDKRVQFKDVSNRLSSHGIDLRYNRFLILQGEVEQISLMKPKAENTGESGMLEFLEDIIGTTRLKAPLEKINERVNELNELRSEKISRCKLVEKEKDALEVVRNEAISYLKLENKLMKKQALLYKKYQEKSIEIQKVVQQEFDTAKEGLNEAIKKLETIKQLQKSKQKDYDEVLVECNSANKKMELLNEKYKTLEKEGEQNRCKNTNVFEKGKKMLEDKVAVETMLKEALGELPKLDQLFEENQSKHRDMEHQYNEAEDRLVELRKTLEGDVKPLRKGKEKYENELLSMQAEINEAKSALELKKSELDQYLLTERQEMSKLVSLESELKSCQTKLEEKEKLISSCSSDLPESEKRIENHTNKMKKLDVRRIEIEQKLSQQQAIFKEAKNMMHESESKNRVLSKIMEQKKAGNLLGVYGRLGDLATIDKKYDVAISTVCAGQLDSILTNNLKTSSQCIDYLKKNNIGSATFSALDQKRKWRHENFDFDEPAERLIDLIDIHDEQYAPAFSDILRDTLVVENSTIANKLAFSGKGWVVVTLNGHIYRNTGVMTGGGRPLSGKMRTTSKEKRASLASGMSAEDINKLEVDIKELEEELLHLNTTYEKMQKEIARAKHDNEFIKYQLPTFRLEAEELTKTIEALETAIGQAKKRVEEVKPDQEKVASFEKDIVKLQSTYDLLKDKAKVWEEKVAEVDKEIKFLIQEKIGPVEREVNKLKKDMEEASFAMSKAEAGKKNQTRTIEKCEEKIKQYKKEVIESNELLAQLKERRHIIRGELDAMEKEKDAFETERSEINTKLKTVAAELQHLKEEERDFQTSNLDTNHKIDILRKKVEEKVRDVQKWSTMIDALKPNILEGVNLGEDDSDNNSNDTNNDEGFDKKENNRKRTRRKFSKQESNEDTDIDDETIMEDEEETDNEDKTINEHHEMEMDVEGEEEEAEKESIDKKDHRKDISLKDLDVGQLQKSIERLDKEIKKIKPNLAAIEEYKKKHQLFMERSKELEDVTKRRDEHREAYENIKNMRMEEFKQGFLTINRKLKEMYRMITLGGDAELEYCDSLDPFLEGIAFSVRPNKKTWKRISNLSGGEKTLSSLALIFALHYFKPSPLYVMDEIDAALDFKNVSIVGNYIKERTKNTQFLIISLRNNMYELSDMLIGIYKTYNSTKTLPYSLIA